jgi:hypothetical protein
MPGRIDACAALVEELLPDDGPAAALLDQARLLVPDTAELAAEIRGRLLMCTEANRSRYEPYGVVVSKKFAYKQGARPVLYLSKKERTELQIPRSELWRVVRFEVSDSGWISWLHEREWRCPGSFNLPKSPSAVLVNTAIDAMELKAVIDADAEEFKSIPKSIVPLQVICQGLEY